MAKIVRGQPRIFVGIMATNEEKAAVKAFLKASANNTALPTLTTNTPNDLSLFSHPSLIRDFPHSTLQKAPLLPLLDLRKRKAQKDALTRLLRKQRKVDAAVFSSPFFPTNEKQAFANHPSFVPPFPQPTTIPTPHPTTIPTIPSIPTLPTLPGFQPYKTKTKSVKLSKLKRPRLPRPSTAALNLAEALTQLYPS